MEQKWKRIEADGYVFYNNEWRIWVTRLFIVTEEKTNVQTQANTCRCQR